MNGRVLSLKLEMLLTFNVPWPGAYRKQDENIKSVKKAISEIVQSMFKLIPRSSERTKEESGRIAFISLLYTPYRTQYQIKTKDDSIQQFLTKF